MRNEYYRTEYTYKKWYHLEDHVKQLNDMTADGWRVDTIFRDLQGKTDGYSGTVYVKTVMTNQPLLERSVNVGEVYKMLNAMFPEHEYDDEAGVAIREFDRKLKAAVRQEGDS